MTWKALILAAVLFTGTPWAKNEEATKPEPETEPIVIQEAAETLEETIPAVQENKPEPIPVIEYAEPEPVPETVELVTDNNQPPIEQTPTRNERYADVEISDAEIKELAALVYLEARGEFFEGQQAVAEVVLNRVLNGDFPDSVHGVIYDTKYGVQFTPYKKVASTTPTDTQYGAVHEALYGEPVLDVGVLYFARAAYNSRIYATIGGHVFCYG